MNISILVSPLHVGEGPSPCLFKSIPDQIEHLIEQYSLFIILS